MAARAAAEQESQKSALSDAEGVIKAVTHGGGEIAKGSANKSYLEQKLKQAGDKG